MTFKALRRYLHDNGASMVRWTRSGTVEMANIEANGAVRITNAVTKKSYILPKRDDHHLEIFTSSHVRLGDQLPKGMR